MTFTDLYHPPDVTAAYEEWHASCGPAALAAVLQRPLAQVHRLLAGYDQRGSMNPTHMKLALGEARCWFQVKTPEMPTPSYGLSFVQWLGPWCDEGVPVAAAYRRTHWIGTAFCRETGRMVRMVYDINAGNAVSPSGAWVPLDWWERGILPDITATMKRATGGYTIRWSCDVMLGQLPARKES